MDSNKKYWKGLEELNQTPAFVEGSKGEFAESIPVEDVLNEAGLSTKTPRRDFLKALGFGLGAVSLAACNRTPVHKAVPYLIKPEEVTQVSLTIMLRRSTVKVSWLKRAKVVRSMLSLTRMQLV